MTTAAMTTATITGAELLSLLRDCLVLWDVDARVQPGEDTALVLAAEGQFIITAAPAAERPARWHLQTPARTAAGREARQHLWQ